MTGPHNTPAPKPNVATLDSRTSELRKALIAAFVATCLFFVFFFGSIALQHGRQEGQPSPPGWVFLLGFGSLLAPYIISWFLLSAREQTSIASGAGVACAFFGAFLLVSPYAFPVMFLFVGMSGWNSKPDKGIEAAALTLLVYMVVSLWIVWSAFRIGKIQWGAFGTALGATALYLYLGFQSFSLTASRGQQHAEQKRARAEMDVYKPAMLARQRIVSLTACLLKNHMLHPDAGYPPSIDPLPPGYTCDPSLPTDPIPEFTFTYGPQTDLANNRISDFQLTAMPGQKGVRGREPMMIDSLGIVFVDYPWEMENVTPKVMVQEGDFFYLQIDALKRNIEQYMKDKSNGLAPATLNAEAIGSLGHEMPTIEDGGTRLETRDFEMLYLPPKPGDPKRFAISVQCKSYAQICLRSYFADYDGSIHATAEPRQATADDPAVFRCEKFFGECEDVIWDPI